jgi:hypothetical protein
VYGEGGGALSLGIVTGCEVDHSSPSCAEVRKDWSYASSPLVIIIINKKPLAMIFIWNLDLKNVLKLHLREANSFPHKI